MCYKSAHVSSDSQPFVSKEIIVGGRARISWNYIHRFKKKKLPQLNKLTNARLTNLFSDGSKILNEDLQLNKLTNACGMHFEVVMLLEFSVTPRRPHAPFACYFLLYWMQSSSSLALSIGVICTLAWFYHLGNNSFMSRASSEWFYPSSDVLSWCSAASFLANRMTLSMLTSRILRWGDSYPTTACI